MDNQESRKKGAASQLRLESSVSGWHRLDDEHGETKASSISHIHRHNLNPSIIWSFAQDSASWAGCSNHMSNFAKDHTQLICVIRELEIAFSYLKDYSKYKIIPEWNWNKCGILLGINSRPTKIIYRDL